MSSNLKVNTILPSTGTNIGVGTAGGTVTIVGDVDIADKIVHTGDTNTSLRFPAADTITAETAGTERVRITSNGSVVLGGDTPATVGQTQLTLRSNSQVGLSLLCGAIQNATITFGGVADGYSSGASGYDDGKIMYDNSNNHMQFNTAGGERLRITSDGDVNLVDGDLVIQTSGHGIDFSARSGSNAGATSSILDDYEEGVYQPTMTGSGSGSHTFVSYTHLAYTKIGRLVHIQGYINTNGGSLTGNLKLSLPFTVSNDATGHSKYAAIKVSWRGHGWSSNTGEITLAAQPNTTYGEFVSVSPNGSHTWVNNTHVNNNYNLRIGGCYITNS